MAVTTLEVKSRTPLAGGRAFGEVGQYEQIDGTVHFAVSPGHPCNTVITDINLAPTDGAGLVGFSSDFCILQPSDPRRGNHRILHDILNRGNRLAMPMFNRALRATDPSAPVEPGDGFLMRQGYTVAWCGWQHDVPSVNGLLRIQVPDAVGHDGPVSGKIVITFKPNAPIRVQGLSDRLHRPYPAADVNDQSATLMVRDHEDAPPQIVPRDQWSFTKPGDGQNNGPNDINVAPDASNIYMASGFVPGKVYQVVYTTSAAPVVGLGLLATRDMVSFLRYGTAQEGNFCADDIQYAYAFGASQSGRFLRTLLYLGLDQDEEERTVFDGLIPHIAGGRRGEFNQRFGQPSSLAKDSMGNLFPFSDTEQTDTQTGRTDGLLSRLSARGKLPKIFLTNSSSEYWRGDASLIHTDPEGQKDISTLENVRIYHFAGTQHGSGALLPLTDTNPVDGSRGQQKFNCVDYVPLLRSALVRLDRWVTSGETPPPSKHPRIDDGTAVPANSTAGGFRAIPGVKFPERLPCISRMEYGTGAESGIGAEIPPIVGRPYPGLVSAVDRDGNETGGIRLPDVRAPLATHTGWNLRHPDMGAPDQIMGLTGSTIPFPATKAEREASGDPRLSIEERYGSKEEYLGRVRQAAQELVDEGHLLAEDMDLVVGQASERYDLFRGRVGAAAADD